MHANRPEARRRVKAGVIAILALCVSGATGSGLAPHRGASGVAWAAADTTTVSPATGRPTG